MPSLSRRDSMKGREESGAIWVSAIKFSIMLLMFYWARLLGLLRQSGYSIWEVLVS